MTFDEIVSRVCDRLNLTSTEAITRVGQFVNDRYRQVVASVGLQPSILTTAIGLTVNGSRYVSFGPTDDQGGVIKILAVYDATVTPERVFSEATFDTLRNALVTSWPPRRYAISNMASDTVTIFLDAEAEADDVVLTADVLSNSDTLADDSEPVFGENFHDILVFGAMSDELDKMEKPSLSDKQEKKFQARLSDLRLFIATSNYLDIVQGARSRGRISQYLL